MGRRKVRKCRICKNSPVWRGGDVKDPGPFCKRCYHKHIWSGGKGGKSSGIDTDDTVPGSALAPLEGSTDWLQPESLDWDLSVSGMLRDLPPRTDDEDEIPF